MHFKYFQGPDEDMAHLEGAHTCSLCGAPGPCFSLDSAFSRELMDAGEGKVGCATCLVAQRFEFWHDTEIGMLSESGLEHVYKHNKEPPADFRIEALLELRYTPQIATWQQEIWLTHCRDFMIYLGTWSPADFSANAADGDGRRLFLEMTDEYPELWDEARLDGESTPATWHATYYAFRCGHCRVLRGNWDCD